MTCNTVRAALRQDAPPHYVRPKRGNPRLEPFSVPARLASALFVQAMELLENLLAGDATRRLGKDIESLSRLDLLVVDELDYIPMDSRGPISSSSWSSASTHERP